jgi:hypothetical protein
VVKTVSKKLNIFREEKYIVYVVELSIMEIIRYFKFLLLNYFRKNNLFDLAGVRNSLFLNIIVLNIPVHTS